MSTQDQFHVYLTGNALDGHELSSAQQAFAEKFKLSSEKAQKVFQSPMPYTVKKSVDSKTAEAYKKAIHAMGLESQIEPVNPTVASKLTLVPRGQPGSEAEHMDAAPQIAASKSYSSIVEQKDLPTTSGQSLEILYEAPNADLMEEDDQSIGGWLRFFQITNVISIVAFVILLFAVAAIGYLESFSSSEVIGMLTGLAEVVPPLVFSILILNVINVRDESTPLKISNYLKYSMLATVTVFFVTFVLFYFDFLTERPQSLLGGLIYYYIWTAYFKKSVRVKAFYGSNTG